LCFIVIVYFLPGGIAPLVERYLVPLFSRRGSRAVASPTSARLAGWLKAAAGRLEAPRQ
jgi:hypothetical protein